MYNFSNVINYKMCKGNVVIPGPLKNTNKFCFIYFTPHEFLVKLNNFSLIPSSSAVGPELTFMDNNTLHRKKQLIIMSKGNTGLRIQTCIHAEGKNINLVIPHLFNY